MHKIIIRRGAANLILADIEHMPAFKHAKKQLCETASLLERKANIPRIKEKLPLLKEINSDDFWNANDILMFEKARKKTQYALTQDR